LSTRALFAAIALVAVAAGTALWWAMRPSAPPPTAPGPIQIAPAAFFAAAFTDASGRRQALGHYEGKLLVVNFWATWCAPCREEMPALAALETARGGADFAVLPIATGRNTPEGIARFMEEANVSALGTAFDPKGKLAAAMQVPGLPVTVILDRDGREIARMMGGADWSSPSALAIVDYLVAHAPDAPAPASAGN
jgi:thiol-disulfide isomerase/thioredoxin